jgi:ParB family transcriptional regulator, chromosome partitioning protein
MTEQKAELKALPVKDVIPTADNPRRAPDPKDTDIRDLAASIEAHGLLHPVVVRKHPAKKGKWDLRCGARRLAAHKAIKADTILAVVREMTDEQAIEATALENLQRQDLTPLEEGRSIRMLLDARPDAAAVAANIGRSVSWVYRRAALANLAEAWQQLFETEGSTICGWSAAHLELVARLDAVLQKKLFAEMHPAEQMSYRSISVTELSRLISIRFVSLTDAPKEFLEQIKPRCHGCPFNSASQPDLFGEDEADAMCHNPECYQKKRLQFAGEGLEQMQRKHGDKLVYISRHGYAAPKDSCLPEGECDILRSWEYTDDAGVLAKLPNAIKRPAFCVDLDDWNDMRTIVTNDDLRAYKAQDRGVAGGEDGEGEDYYNDTPDPRHTRHSASVEKITESCNVLADKLEQSIDDIDQARLIACLLGMVASFILEVDGLDENVFTKDLLHDLGIFPDDDEEAPDQYEAMDCLLTAFVRGRDIQNMASDFVLRLLTKDLRNIRNSYLLQCARAKGAVHAFRIIGALGVIGDENLVSRLLDVVSTAREDLIH